LQVLAELLAIVLVISLWGIKLAAGGFGVPVRSDSLAALSVTDKLAGSSPSTNFLAAELALKLECAGIQEVSTLHIPGVLNEVADWLSRKAEPGRPVSSPPAPLKGAKQRPPPSREKLFILPLPTGERRSLWQGHE